MKRVLPALLALSMLATPALAQNPGQQAAPAQGDDAKNTSEASYAIGLSIGNNLKEQELDLDAQQLVQGLMDALKGAEPKLSEEQLRGAMQQFQQRQIAKMKARQDAAQAESAKFLVENAKKPGVKTTESGLQYKVLKSGDGPSPKAEDTVTVHYRGTLTDGTEFDSSYKRGQPATFPVNGVIAGWTEALQLMQVGDRWQLVIPSELAYGERGTPGGPIGPNATLVFEVELLGIK